MISSLTQEGRGVASEPMSLIALRLFQPQAVTTKACLEMIYTFVISTPEAQLTVQVLWKNRMRAIRKLLGIFPNIFSYKKCILTH